MWSRTHGELGWNLSAPDDIALESACLGPLALVAPDVSALNDQYRAAPELDWTGLELDWTGQDLLVPDESVNSLVC